MHRPFYMEEIEMAENKWICPACGQENDGKFCVGCGAAAPAPAADTAAPAAEEVTEAVAEAVPAAAEAAEAAPAAEAAEAAPVVETTTSYDKYIVPSLKDLESGKYYIQIAVYASDENILEVINKYGNNYPITIVPMAGGNKKQILVGPVTMDEYKVVLERFKSYGFKDAFLRKVR